MPKSSPLPYTIGLTGGIGSGKTVVSDFFAQLGIGIIDTDIIARDIVQPGSSTLLELTCAFGEKILNKKKELQRDILRDIVFSCSENKKQLDAIMHPKILASALHQLTVASSQYAILVIPLLQKKSAFFSHIDRALLISATQSIKIQRVMRRSQLSEKEVLAIIKHQISDKQRELFCHDIIRNNSALQEVEGQVKMLHQQYLRLSNTQ